MNYSIYRFRATYPPLNNAGSPLFSIRTKLKKFHQFSLMKLFEFCTTINVLVLVCIRVVVAVVVGGILIAISCIFFLTILEFFNTTT